jgi:exopolysaccharide production protein ExoZ
VPTDMTATASSAASTQNIASVHGRLTRLQCLRGVAAVIVVMSHSLHEVADKLTATPLTLRLPAISGHLGVDVFFVISGFVMFYISAEHFGKQGAPLRFLRSRFIRIVPLYWFYTSLWLVTASVMANELNRAGIDPLHLAASYLFWPYPRPDGGELFPVLAGGWSLNYEMFFYAIFAALLFTTRRFGLWLLGGIFIGLIALHPLFPFGALEFWSRQVILEFFAGVVLAVLFRRFGPVAWPRFVAPVVVAALLLFVLPMSDPPLEYGDVGSLTIILVWATIVVAAAVFPHEDQQPNRMTRALAALGDSSYSLYLSHAFTLGLAGVLAKRLHLLDHMPAEAVWTLMVIASIAGGFISYATIERPLLKLFRKRPAALRDAVPLASS